VEEVFTRAVDFEMPLDCWGWLAGGGGAGVGVVVRFWEVIFAYDTPAEGG
jgi:hypothetical protein